MQNYIELVKRVLDTGSKREDRTGVGTLSVFGGHIEWDLRDRFPLVTAKETRWRVAFLEMLFFIGGHTNAKWLEERGSKLWTPWADEAGDLGPIYGAVWRCFVGPRGEEIDQVKSLINGLISNPAGRRHIVTAWHVSEIPHMALPPCHAWHQCYVDGEWLDMQVYQRSWDLALGAPFNIAQYALLLHLYARATGLKPRKLSFAFGDAHIYLNHVDVMRNVVEIGPMWGDAARLEILTDNTDIDGYTIDDFRIVDYTPRAFVSLPVAV